MGFKDTLLQMSIVYKSWATLTSTAKMEAIEKILPPVKGKTVLDLGCGPAVNTSLFTESDYTGIDINPQYIEQSQRKFPKQTFYTQDVTNLDLVGKSFDIILLNSMIHHIPDENMNKLFTEIAGFLNTDGSIILSEPLIPEPQDKIPRLAMHLDRGNHFRTREGYQKLFDQHFTIDEEHTYPLKMFGVIGWSMFVVRLKKHG